MKKDKKKKKKKEHESDEEEETEDTPSLLDGVMEPIHSDAAFKKEIYFIGIIDPLSRYKLRKKVAHFLKEMIWEDDTLSTVRPTYLALHSFHRKCEPNILS